MTSRFITNFALPVNVGNDRKHNMTSFFYLPVLNNVEEVQLKVTLKLLTTFNTWGFYKGSFVGV